MCSPHFHSPNPQNSPEPTNIPPSCSPIGLDSLPLCLSLDLGPSIDYFLFSGILYLFLEEKKKKNLPFYLQHFQVHRLRKQTNKKSSLALLISQATRPISPDLTPAFPSYLSLDSLAHCTSFSLQHTSEAAVLKIII